MIVNLTIGFTSDEDRVGDINAMFADPSVKAIIACRGGWGDARLLDKARPFT